MMEEFMKLLSKKAKDQKEPMDSSKIKAKASMAKELSDVLGSDLTEDMKNKMSDSSNWSRISIVYKSNPGKQYEIVEFDPAQITPTGIFSISQKARNVFQVQSLQIFDFDGGVLDIYRSQLTTADFDIDLT